MNIRIGSNRIVLLVSSLGIAIKIPRIRFFVFLKDTFRNVHNRTLIKSWSYPMQLYFSPKNMLFKGIADNWRESSFWRNKRHRFTQPTIFSLFGFVNIQRLGEPCTVKRVDHWCQLHEITDGAVFQDSHHFENPQNFCFCGSEIRIIDYGSPKVQSVIEEYGLSIIEQYDPAYDWEEQKKLRKNHE